MVAPLVAASLISGGAGLASSLVGLFGKSKDAQEAERKRQLAIAEFDKLRIPQPEEMYANIQNLVQQGVLKPEDIPILVQDPTLLNQVRLNPQGLEAEYAALNKLKEITEKGGLDPQAKLAIQQAQDDLNTIQHANSEAVRQRAKEMGIGGSQFDLLSQQVEGQAASNASARAGAQIASDANQRALDALMKSANLGSTITGEEYGREAEKAKSQDLINQFNTQLAQGVTASNVESRNAAQAANLAEKQRIADTNVANANAEAVRRATIPQTIFQDELAKTAGKTGQLAGGAAANTTQGSQEQAGLVGLGSGLMTTGANLYAEYLKGKNKQAASAPTVIPPTQSDIEKERGFAEGGIVTKRTEAIIGEKGEPEYIIPESKLKSSTPELAALKCAIQHLSKRMDEHEGAF